MVGTLVISGLFILVTTILFAVIPALAGRSPVARLGQPAAVALMIAFMPAYLSGAILPAQQAPTVYLPAILRSDLPQTIQVPADHLIDSPFIEYDGAGNPYLAVQAVVGSEHAKVAVVYVFEANGMLREVLRDRDIYGSPKLIERPDGVGIVYGDDRDGDLHWAPVPGWVP